MGKGCFAAIVCFVLLLSSDIGAQDSNFRVVFEGNEEFSSAELSKEFAKCPFPLNSYTDNERLISIVSACLRGTVFSLYGSRGFWEIQKRTDIQSRLSESQKIITVSIDEPER